MKKTAAVVILLLTTLVLLALLEAMAMVGLKGNGQAFPFLINYSRSTELADAKSIGFDEINPLWGWNMSAAKLQQKGFDTHRGLIVLRSEHATDSSLRLFITGGSTSDLAIDSNNWPMALHRLLNEQGMEHTIFVGAVGGFNSAQEYLRLIEIGLSLRPHLHISYSGANETGDFGFATEYEKDFYTQALNRQRTTFLAPNLIYFIRHHLLPASPDVTLSSLPEIKTAERFKKNLGLMRAAARQFDYRYIGILQPLRGMGHYRQTEGKSFNMDYLEDYKKYYPTMQQWVKQYPDELFDFTAIFDTASSAVYYDDCHLLPAYQSTVAKNILQCLSLTAVDTAATNRLSHAPVQ